MKKNNLAAVIFSTIVGLTAFSATSCAQETVLPAPQKSTTEGSLSKALQDRKSVRKFSDKTLTDQQLADLLWAACGVNRPDGHLTVPSARNKQDITVYVGKGNAFIKTAPVVIVIASDTSLQGGNMAICGIDAGAVMQNVYLHCAANGLATVCCYAGDDVTAMQKFLGIKAELKPLICMPVGIAE